MLKYTLIIFLLLATTLLGMDERLLDYPNGKNLYEKAIANDENGTFYLALLYKQDIKDYDKAVYWYEKAYELGSVDAAFNLGNLYNEQQAYKSVEVICRFDI
jgi:TPR repeat protein